MVLIQIEEFFGAILVLEVVLEGLFSCFNDKANVVSAAGSYMPPSLMQDDHHLQLQRMGNATESSIGEKQGWENISRGSMVPSCVG